MDREKLIKSNDFFKNKDFDSLFDSLTKVVNRKNMIEYIQYLIGKGIPFSMFLFDIDNFKEINDTYGHQTGDEVLSRSIEILKDRIGDDSILGRFGGDEFILINFKALTYDEMMTYMRSVHNCSLPYQNICKNINITFTIGGVSFPKDGTNYDEIQNIMDKCMYRGKQKGRNCFIIYVKEKHAGLIAEKKTILNSLLFEDTYQILMRDNFKIENLRSYLQANIDIPGIDILSQEQLDSYFIKDGQFVKHEYDKFNRYLKKNRFFIIKDFADVISLYPVFSDNIYSQMKALILFPISKKNQPAKYLALFDNERKHLWQDRDIILASYCAKILTLKE